MNCLQVKFCVFFILMISPDSLFAQNKSLSVMGISLIQLNSVVAIYEHKIEKSEAFDINGVAFIGITKYDGLQFSDKGVIINGGVGGFGFSLVKHRQKSSKWEFGFKIFRLNSGTVDQTYFGSFHLGLRWDGEPVLVRFGIETMAGLYLSLGHQF